MIRYAYIAGPITGVPEQNRPVFEAARVRMRQHVETPRRIVTPHDLVEPGWSEARAMNACLSFICDVIEDGCDLTMVLLPGWRDSLGTAVEVALARKLGVPVVELVNGALREMDSVLLWTDKTSEAADRRNGATTSDQSESREGDSTNG